MARLWYLLLPLLTCAQDDDTGIAVHEMLRAAVEKVSAAEAEKITESCVSKEIGDKWRSSFKESVDTMLQKTKRSMQKGLAGVAQGVIDLLDGISCEQISTFGRFREQANRLHVLATARSLKSLDAKHVQYEPLKALMVGDVDIHEELNRLIIGWQLNKGAVEVGQALTDFLRDFAAEDLAESDSVDAELSAPSGPAPHDLKHTPDFWALAMSKAFQRLGDASNQVTTACFDDSATDRYSQQVNGSFYRMMEKTRRSMQTGLKMISQETITFLDVIERSCPATKDSKAVKHFRSAVERLVVLSNAKTIMNHGVHVEYEALKALKVGGIDVHIELNKLIGGWIGSANAQDIGEALADFFEDFKEQEEEDTQEETAEAESEEAKHPVFTMLRDAIRSAQAGIDEKLTLDSKCFAEDITAEFEKEVNGAIEHMLQKRMRKMQQGLKEFADAIDKLMASQAVECVWSSGAKIIWLASKKLRKLTRRTIVDYGTHIKYEAMKGLTVGSVDIHAELNGYLAAWKLRSVAEAGKPFGELMLKLSKISGHDEL